MLGGKNVSILLVYSEHRRSFQCSTENARNDVFLDLPLAIKPFGAQQAYRSIEEALRAFVHPEVLDGTNQYHCEKCQKKVNAHKVSLDLGR